MYRSEKEKEDEKEEEEQEEPKEPVTSGTDNGGAERLEKVNLYHQAVSTVVLRRRTTDGTAERLQ